MKLTVVFCMIINLIEDIHHCLHNQHTTFIIVGKSSLFIIFAVHFSKHSNQSRCSLYLHIYLGIQSNFIYFIDNNLIY